MFRGAPVDLSYYAHKKCYGCNVSTIVFKLSQCTTCNIEYCYNCWDGFVRTCECSTANNKGHIRANECNRAICQRCKDRDSITCCNKRKYCKSRYFGYCDDCFGNRLIFLSKEDLLPVSRGYLMYIIKEYITDLKKIDDIPGDKIKLLEDVYSGFKLSHELANLYCFSDAKAAAPTLDKTSQYIWSGYVQDNNMPINDLYVKEIVLRKYVTLYGITDTDGKGLSIMYTKQFELLSKLNYNVCSDMLNKQIYLIRMLSSEATVGSSEDVRSRSLSKIPLGPNATSKVSLSNLSSQNGKKEVYDNLRLGGMVVNKSVTTL